MRRSIETPILEMRIAYGLLKILEKVQNHSNKEEFDLSKMPALFVRSKAIERDIFEKEEIENFLKKWLQNALSIPLANRKGEAIQRSFRLRSSNPLIDEFLVQSEEE